MQEKGNYDLLVTLLTTSIKAILLNDGFREAGSSEFNGRMVSWEAGYVVTFLPYGEKRGESIRKYVVDPSIAKSVQSELVNTSWGSLLELSIDDKKIIGCKVIYDLSNVVPIE